MPKIRTINLTTDKISIHPTLIKKHVEFSSYQSEFKTAEFSKEFICEAVKVSPLHVIKNDTGEYLCIAGYEWLESLYQFTGIKIQVILHEDINSDRIETMNIMSLLLSQCLIKERHIFLAYLSDLIEKSPRPIMKKLLGDHYSYSGCKVVQNMTSETRKAVKHQEGILRSQQVTQPSHINIINFLIEEEK